MRMLTKVCFKSWNLIGGKLCSFNIFLKCLATHVSGYKGLSFLPGKSQTGDPLSSFHSASIERNILQMGNTTLLLSVLSGPISLRKYCRWRLIVFCLKSISFHCKPNISPYRRPARAARAIFALSLLLTLFNIWISCSGLSIVYPFLKLLEDQFSRKDYRELYPIWPHY
jgi:hypothetical protein